MHRWSRALMFWTAFHVLTCCAAWTVAAEPQDDWYYPAEEPAERAAIERPWMREVEAGSAVLARSATGPAVKVKMGGEFDGWRLVETLPVPEPIAILEREFDRWGMILFLGREKTVAEVRKAVGRLDKIHGPRLSFSESYAQELMNSKDDLLADRLLVGGRDPTYLSVAALLPPLEDPWSLDTPQDTYTFLGTPEAPRKLAVGPDGCIGVRFESHNRKPLLERVLFDPWQGTAKPTGPIAAKRGVLGGFLPAVNYGFFDPQARTGLELCALVDRGDAAVALTRTRHSDGRMTFHQLEPFRELPDGKAFYAALLRLHQSWQTFFKRGMQIDIPDRRLADAARAAVVRAMTSYAGLHPKYGLGAYWRKSAEGFPPQTVSLNTCLLDWGLGSEARERLGYFLTRFVKADGTIDYYGTAVSDFGQLLEVAVRCAREAPDEAWFDAHRQPIQRIVAHLLKLRAESKHSQSPDAIAYGLLYGSPEADTHKQTDYYFSGSVWAWRGLLELGRFEDELGRRRHDAELRQQSQHLLAECGSLRKDILRAVERSIDRSGTPPFLPPIAGRARPFQAMWENQLSHYTNFRYWLETTSANCLPAEQERLMLDFRRARGGELLSMTRFDRQRLDDWPYWHHAHSLLCHDQIDRYLTGLFGHMAHHQTQGTFTAFELVYINGATARCIYDDYCVPSQMTVPLMLRWMLAFEDRDADTLWLCRAVPRSWWQSRVEFRGARTRWGTVSLRLEPNADQRAVAGRIEFSGKIPQVLALRVRHPRHLDIGQCRLQGAICAKFDNEQESVFLHPTSRSIDIQMAFSQRMPKVERQMTSE